MHVVNGPESVSARCLTFADAAESVRRQCLTRTKLAGFFNILLGLWMDVRSMEEVHL